MEKIISFTLVGLLLFNVNSNVRAENLEMQNNKKDISEICRDSVITLLNPYLQAAVSKYYESINKPTREYGLYDAKILELREETEGSFSFYTKVKLNTFSGAHNPPYGIEIVSLKFNAGSVQVTNYEHQEIKNIPQK